MYLVYKVEELKTETRMSFIWKHCLLHGIKNSFLKYARLELVVEMIEKSDVVCQSSG